MKYEIWNKLKLENIYCEN